MSDVAWMLLVALCLALLGLLCVRNARRIGGADGPGFLLIGLVNLFLAFVFLILSLLRAVHP
jgi:hypothetical protein